MSDLMDCNQTDIEPAAGGVRHLFGECVEEIDGARQEAALCSGAVRVTTTTRRRAPSPLDTSAPSRDEPLDVGERRHRRVAGSRHGERPVCGAVLDRLIERPADLLRSGSDLQGER